MAVFAPRIALPATVAPISADLPGGRNAAVLVNQGAVLLSGQPSWSLLWQIPLTYAVPFCVATWGALSNSRG
jgi:hypothetical protein